jgi:hypothetical protein
MSRARNWIKGCVGPDRSERGKALITDGCSLLSLHLFQLHYHVANRIEAGLPERL